MRATKQVEDKRPIREEIEAALAHGIDITGRKVFLHSDVDEMSIARTIRGLYLLDNVCQDPIELFVSSFGGSLEDAFALHDVTRTIKSPVHTIALGKCMSAAPLLVACGQKKERYATENTLFMLHDVRLYYDTAVEFPEELANVANVSRHLMDKYATLLGKYTKKRKTYWQEIFAKRTDTYFIADEAIALGIADAVWSEKD